MTKFCAWVTKWGEGAVLVAKWFGALVAVLTVAAWLGSTQWVTQARAAQQHAALSQSVTEAEQRMRLEQAERFEALLAEIKLRDQAWGKRFDDQAELLRELRSIVLRHVEQHAGVRR